MNLSDHRISADVSPSRSDDQRKAADTPPLTLPDELWSEVPPAERVVLRRAEKILQVFPEDDVVSLSDLSRKTAFEPSDVLESLRILQQFGLVRVGVSGEDVLARLIARPEEHVRIRNPGQAPRWVFISRPVEPPDVEPELLN